MTTNITKQPGKVAEDDTAVTKETDSFLRAQHIVTAINANLPDGLPKLQAIPKGYVFRKRDRETVSIALHVEARSELTRGARAELTHP